MSLNTISFDDRYQLSEKVRSSQSIIFIWSNFDFHVIISYIFSIHIFLWNKSSGKCSYNMIHIHIWFLRILCAVNDQDAYYFQAFFVSREASMRLLISINFMSINSHIIDISLKSETWSWPLGSFLLGWYRIVRSTRI